MTFGEEPLIYSSGNRENLLRSVRLLTPFTDNRKIIYVRIPRCAGTSMAHFFSKNNMYGRVGKSRFDVTDNKFIDFYCDHVDENVLNIEKIEDVWNCAFKFAVVRHPIERFISGFYYSKYRLKQRCLKEISMDIFAENISERSFRNGLSKTVKKHILRKQIDHCIQDCDILIKLENIREEFEVVKRLSGATGKLRKVNKIKKPNIELSSESREKLREYFAEDFYHLGYV